jgi:phospholipid N-methyltransferase
MSTSTYVKAFLKDKDVAAVTPSSSFGTRHVCRPVDFDRAHTVVEYGPGTGVFTRYFLERMPENGRLFAIEANSRLVSALTEEVSDSRLTVCEGDARNVAQLMKTHEVPEADYVISGIPFSWLDPEGRRGLLKQTYEILGPEGMFLAYQTFWQPDAHLKQPAEEYFPSVWTEFELLNLPPMRIYRATKRTNGISS